MQVSPNYLSNLSIPTQFHPYAYISVKTGDIKRRTSTHWHCTYVDCRESCSVPIKDSWQPTTTRAGGTIKTQKYWSRKKFGTKWYDNINFFRYKQKLAYSSIDVRVNNIFISNTEKTTKQPWKLNALTFLVGKWEKRNEEREKEWKMKIEVSDTYPISDVVQALATWHVFGLAQSRMIGALGFTFWTSQTFLF